MKEITYTSFLGKDITEYVRFKCSLGYSASTYDEALRRFDTFCAENYPSEDTVTEQIVNRWLEKRPGENTNGHIRRMITLKGFLKFLKARKPDIYTIPDGVIGEYKPYMPYLYSDDELDRFFLASDTMPVNPVAVHREKICPVIFRMLYCCGLRPQEPIKLLRSDVNLVDGTIYIADSKVHKDRVVAMSEELRDLCAKYDSLMEFCMPGRIHFFQRPDDGNAYDIQWLQRTFRSCIRHSGLSFSTKHPRVYDWRHNFATRVIRKWIQQGVDVAVMLPYLSTYMGHTSLEDTAYYVHLVPEHLEKSRMNEWSAIPEVPAYED